MKDGREVPNCVPKDNFNEIVVEELIRQKMSEQLYDTKEEAEQAAKALGCKGAHQMGDKWMPCEKHIDALSEEEQDAIIDALDVVGISEKEMEDAGYIEIDKDAFYKHVFTIISAKPNKPSIADFGNFAVRYRYAGPKDSRNRDFCATLLSKNLVFRKEDINSMSIKSANREFGTYDIFTYKGSFNCRHYWQEVFYKRDTDITAAKRSLASPKRDLQATTINPPVSRAQQAAESFAALDDQQIVVGPLMVPNKLIRRMDEDGEYYVYFTDDTIKKLAHKAMKDKIIDRVNIEHDGEDKVNAFMVESWIKEGENDKSKEYGYNLPNGTWFAKYKIEDKAIWDDYIKSGAVKGFSVEGLFESIMLSACKTGKRCACGLSKTGVCDGSHAKK